MKPEAVFAVANPLALTGWLLLALFPKPKWSSTYVAGRLIPLLLSATYLLVLAFHWGEARGSFSTLDGVARLFENHWILLAGWTHYLAFDLFTGAWEVRDANARGIHRLFVLPCLFLTFMFGPIGLLCYFGLRAATRNRAINQAR